MANDQVAVMRGAATDTPSEAPASGREQHLQAALEASHVWVQLTCGGPQEHIEREVALLSPFVQREVLRSGHGVSESDPVVLPKQVTGEVLALLLTYCRYHRVPGHSDKERKAFDERFIRLDTRRLCELTSAADSLEMKPLVDLTSRALARMIEGKSPEEIRATFNLPDDLTEEEKLEPLKSGLADARIKLLNKLYAKKRQSLAVKKAAVGKLPTPAAGTPADDNRSLDQLLSFIQEGSSGNGSSGKGKSRSKRKKSRSKKAETAAGAATEAADSGSAGEARPDVAAAAPATAGQNGRAARGAARSDAAPDAVADAESAAASAAAAGGAGAVAAAAAPAPAALPASAEHALAARQAGRAEPGSMHQLPSDDEAAVNEIARRLHQDPREQQVVSTLTSLRNFCARLPNGGACLGSNAEDTTSGSDFSDVEYEATSDDEELLAPSLPAAIGVARVPHGAGQAAAAHTAAAPAAAQPSASAQDVADAVGAIPTDSSAKAASGTKQDGAEAAAGKAPQTSAPESASQRRAAAAAAEPSAVWEPAAGSGRPRTPDIADFPRTPDIADFQALSSVLRNFLAAVQDTTLLQLSADKAHAARLQIVRRDDGSLAARTASGASVQLSWQFPAPSC